MQKSSLIALRSVTNLVQSQDGIEANLGHEKLRIDVIKSDLLRVKISRGGVFDESPSYALAIDPIAVANTLGLDRSFSVEHNTEKATLSTANLRFEIQLQNFSIDVYRTDGSVVFQSKPGFAGYATLNDAFELYRSAGADDAIYGLGEKTGGFDRRGRDFTLWNVDVLSPAASGEFTKALPGTDPRADNTSIEFDPYYVSIPFYYHQDSASGMIAGSFIDNGYRSYYDFRPADHYRIKFEGGQYTEYFFAGPSMAAILTDYTWLTGRTALPPIWALGHHQCRWHQYSQQQVLDLAAKYQELQIPVDVLWLDIDYMDGYRVFTWNEGLFPSPEAMLAQLRSEGIRVVTIIDPGVKFDPGYQVFDSGLARDVFCKTEGGDIYIGQVWPGNTAFPDFVNPDARDWWGDLNAKHVKSGLAGIWNDMNEPATGDIPAEHMRFGNGEFSHERYHNAYALLMAMGTVQGLRESMPDLRTFVLSRAGSPGIQRYAANWMGDNMSRWDHLWLSIPMGAGLSISGQSFVGADIGGFGEDSNPELLSRWIQYGALTPFARNHSVAGQIDQYPWSFGPEVLDIYRDAVNLRYRLMPYLYSAFVKASETGAPIQRPLIFDYQYDSEVRNTDDQYLLGDHILVAPITEAKSVERGVYLPAGEWFDWNLGTSLLSKGERHRIAAPAENIPVLVKAGAVIPMWQDTPLSTDGHFPNQLELRVFVPSTDGMFESFLQEDDGLTFGALNDERVVTTITLKRSGGELLITGKSTGLGFPEFARKSFLITFVGTAKTIPEPILLENSGQDFELSIALA